MVQLSIKGNFSGLSYEEFLNVWKEGERLGYDSVLSMDNIIPVVGGLMTPTLEIWTIMGALARETKKIRFGTSVTCNGRRHPALVAKMAATLDAMSGGRFELGMGVGDELVEEQFTRYGMPWPKPSIRIEMLAEAIQIIKKMWAEDEPIFTGKYYHIDKALCFPKPVQKPRPPIWVGIYSGRKLMPRLVAEHADGVLMAIPWVDVCQPVLDAIKENCVRLGRDYGSIHKECEAQVTVAESASEIPKMYQETVEKKRVPLDTLMEQLTYHGNIAGTPEQVAQELQKVIDIGVTHLTIRFTCDWKLAPLEIFMRKVAPLLKDRS